MDLVKIRLNLATAYLEIGRDSQSSFPQKCWSGSGYFHLKGDVVSNSECFFYIKKHFFMIFEETVLRAPWTDFKFPKTAHTYVFRTFHLIFFWGSHCYSGIAYLHDPGAQFQFIYHYESTILWLCCTVFIITKTSFIHDISRKYESFCFEEVSMLLCIILGWSQVNFRICYWILRELDTTSPFKSYRLVEMGSKKQKTLWKRI